MDSTINDLMYHLENLRTCDLQSYFKEHDINGTAFDDVTFFDYVLDRYHARELQWHEDLIYTILENNDLVITSRNLMILDLHMRYDSKKYYDDTDDESYLNMFKLVCNNTSAKKLNYFKVMLNFHMEHALRSDHTETILFILTVPEYDMRTTDITSQSPLEYVLLRSDEHSNIDKIMDSIMSHSTFIMSDKYIEIAKRFDVKDKRRNIFDKYVASK